MARKKKQRNSDAYKYVMQRLHNVQLEGVIANTQTVFTKDIVAKKPSQTELDQIMPSCSVKVFENYELFWVTVQYVEGDEIIGIVNNHLLKEHLYGYGDILLLNKSDVIEVSWPEILRP